MLFTFYRSAHKNQFCRIIVFRKRAAKCDAILRKNILNHDIMMAVKRFLILLDKINIGQNNTISLQDFRRVFEAVRCYGTK